MKKCSICLMIMAFIFVLTACGQQKREKEDLQDMTAHRTYLYEKEGFGGAFAIQINDDGTFTYYEGYFSSYIGIGSWVLDDDILVLSDDDKIGYAFVNRFKVDGSDLVFLSEGSSNFLYVKVGDGERFTGASDEENRLKNKASKRDIEVSNSRLIRYDARYRLVSREGEIPFENYLRLENTEISAEEAAEIIQQRFGFE